MNDEEFERYKELSDKYEDALFDLSPRITSCGIDDKGLVIGYDGPLDLELEKQIRAVYPEGTILKLEWGQAPMLLQ